MRIIISALLIALAMSGCFKSEAPKCSDADVQATVKSVYIQMLDNIHNSGNILLAGFSANLPAQMQELSSIRAIAYDDVVKLRSCKATASFDANQTVSIAYTVQLNEENSDEFYVELESDFVEALMQESLMNGIFDRN